MARLYTRTGDQGKTALVDGVRLTKDSLRIEVLGDIDELNAWLGMLLAYDIPDAMQVMLRHLQQELFVLGAEVAGDPTHQIVDRHVRLLEKTIDEYSAQLSPLKAFILPGGDQVVATCHIVRTVSRRAERHLVALNRSESINVFVLAYMNRLSDLFFILARKLAQVSGLEERYWQNLAGDGLC